MGLNREELSEKIAGLIRSKKEGKTWDFKEKWYKDKKDFVRTILAMANNATIDDSYIIIGVKDKSCLPSDGPDWRKGAFKQTSDLNNWLRDIPFDNFNYPDLELETAVKVRAKVDGTEHDYSLDVIVIKSTANVPYYLSSDLQCKKGVKKQEIYIRMKDQNVLATPLELEELYRKKFGLTLSIRDRFELLLSNKDDWGLMSYKQPFIFLPVEKSYIVHKYCPDFFMEIKLTNNPSFGRHELFPTFCCDWCNATSSLFFGVLRLLYGKFLVDKFWIVFIDGLCFVEPSHVRIPQCLDKTMKFYGFFYFIENDVKFNINNILKKVCAHQKYLRSKWVPVNPPEDAFIEDDGWCRSRVKNDIKKDVYSIHEYMKKYIIYFKDEEEKTKYQDYLVNNKEAIRNYLENLNLNDNIFRENLSRNFNKGMDIDKINRIVELHCIRKFFVKNFYEWKISRCLSKVTFGCLADYLCAFFCDNVRFNIVPRCREDFNCHLPDFIAYFHNEIESGLIFRYEYDECTVDYRTEIKKNFFSSCSFEFKGVTVSVCDGEYNVGLIPPNKNDGAGEFCYFYFFKNNIEYEINNIILRYCLTSSEVSDKINGRFEECKKVFDSYMIHFKDENEKREFDKYLETNKEVVEDVNSFYEKNREELEKNCKGKICKLNNKLCPTEDDIKKMVRVGVFAKKVTKIFKSWKETKG